MSSQYSDGSYLAKNPSWSLEDSSWKVGQIHSILVDNALAPGSVVEIGCGVGGVLAGLADRFPDARCDGYDISPQALALARNRESRHLHFHLGDLNALPPGEKFDLLLAIDVVEHVRDYLGFLEACRPKATHKVYHFPLEMHVSGILRDAYMHSRAQVGHLHYFSAMSALASLRDTGHEVLECRYTASTLALFKFHPALKTAVANVPRWLISRFSPSLAARLLGGFSLLVLAR